MKLTGRFDTRRDAEMTVERLVQEHGIDRNDIVVAAAGDANSAGVERSGSDEASALEGPREDAALDGQLLVVVRLADDEQARKVQSAFAEFSSGNAA